MVEVQSHENLHHLNQKQIPAIQLKSKQMILMIQQQQTNQPISYQQKMSKKQNKQNQRMLQMNLQMKMNQKSHKTKKRKMLLIEPVVRLEI